MDAKKIKREIVFTQKLRDMDFTFHSTWGLFSPRAVDEGSRLLIEELEVGAELFGVEAHRSADGHQRDGRARRGGKRAIQHVVL